jgi:uncharacterized integral membrane protein
MSLFQFMSIAVVSIAIAVAVVSNLTNTVPLVFGNARTVPIPLGLLALSAGSTGILASVFLRLIATGSRRAPKAERRTAQPEFDEEPILADPQANANEEPFGSVDRPWREPAERFDRSDRSDDPDRAASQYENRTQAPVYDANYRVINAPPHPTAPQPQVNSKLKSDEEDWGFDFEEDDG